MCRLASFLDASLDACVGGDCLIVGGFGGWEVFLVDEFVPCLMYGMCGCCYRFGHLSVLLGCW
jgi:hypothetical protein